MAQLRLPFGTTESGTPAHLYLLTNSRGMTVGVTDMGASLVSVRVPDARGALTDVLLGWGGASFYEHNDGCLGATVGRVANRVAGASFELDGSSYRLAANEGENSLHSGPDGWDGRLWELEDAGAHHVTLGLVSPAGDQGYPGEVRVRVTYRLSEDDVLTISQSATADTRTPINLTNHSYWNLDGHASGDMLDHELQLCAESYLPVDAGKIPIEGAGVAGTPFDLRTPKSLRSILGELPEGLDHNYCLAADGELRKVARLSSARSGIAMELATDAPGLQVYMGAHFGGVCAKDGAHYDAFAGVALETQGWPDAIHHDDWPSVVYGPERPFARTTTFTFSTAGAAS